MEKDYRDIIAAIGEDLTRPGLAETPKRAAKAMDFLMRGYRQNIDEVINNALFRTSLASNQSQKSSSPPVLGKCGN